MPQFKSTYNILKKVDADEVFNPNWMDSDDVILPPSTPWDYKREMTIEDVDIWEVLVLQGGGWGVYAAWAPYADFFMITLGPDWRNESMRIDNAWYQHKKIETFYGPKAQEKTFARAKELGLHIPVYKSWINEDELWLHNDPQEKKIILI